MNEEAVEGTRVVDRGSLNGYPGVRRSFHTASFVILRLTHARSLLHLDIGPNCTALGIYRDRAACTAGPAAATS